MVYCAAYNCTNRPEKDKKDGQERHYFVFPRPESEKLRCKQWLHNIGTGISITAFKWNYNKTVCSDHFHPSCLTENSMAKVIPGYQPCVWKLTTKPGAIPTIFSHKVYRVININGEIPGDTRTSEVELERKEVITVVDLNKIFALGSQIGGCQFGT